MVTSRMIVYAAGFLLVTIPSVAMETSSATEPLLHEATTGMSLFFEDPSYGELCNLLSSREKFNGLPAARRDTIRGLYPDLDSYFNFCDAIGDAVPIESYTYFPNSVCLVVRFAEEIERGTLLNLAKTLPRVTLDPTIDEESELAEILAPRKKIAVGPFACIFPWMR